MSRGKNATKQAKSSDSASASKPEPEPVKEDVVEATPDVEDHTSDVDEAVEDKDLDTVERVDQITEMTKMLFTIAQKLQKRSKDLKQRVTAKERRRTRMEMKKAANKKKGGSGGLKKLQPVYTDEFRCFVEKHHQELKDKEGTVILESLEYDTESKKLLVSRESCLKLVNAYVRQKSLQQYENDKKRIKMDATLRELFPELVEEKQGKKVVREENCYFHTLMGGINRHLKVPVTQ